ncbi:MAG TPA: galactonate dehydratase [Thermomicrobiales bacterium]|jgi:galactonate dehydratase|nr:galactonate dehydratase [Thermomicrobiales bacterium]
MKITALRNLFMRVERQNWHFIEIATDEGITGLGEASLEGREQTVAAAVDEFARYLIGEDPGPIEHHWQRLHRHGFWRGGVVLTSALSGIEQALWDIKGKALGVPVYELLGGPTRQRVRVYTHCGGPTPEAAAEHARALVAQGFTALKFGTGRIGPSVDERTMIRRTAAMFEAVRAAVGPEVDLMLDNHGQFPPAQATALLRAIEPYNLFFFEEATPPDNVQALAKVAAARGAVPLATGERLFTRWEYRELLEQQIVDIVQPDICHAGGILELRKIAALAETYYVKVAPHNPNGPVATAASAQLAATIPNFAILELALSQPHRDLVQREGPVVTNGYIELSRRPGLGIELDHDVIAAHPYAPHDYAAAYNPDGSVADI